MHICDYGVMVMVVVGDISISLYIKIQEQYTLEEYYYIALYRQQIPTVWLGRE